jgi:hypothetical protein
LDSQKRPRTACRWWPEVHEKQRDGSQGCIRVIAPNKATRKFITKRNYMFYEWEMNLATDQLVGPFNFVHTNNESHRISDAVWTELETVADPAKIDLGNLRRVTPVT